MSRMSQYVESRHRVFCYGRCITGQNHSIFCLALLLITVASSLFFVFDCPYLTKELSPLIPVFAAILFLSVICCILRTACTDPGILPRATPDELLYLERTDNTQTVALSGRVMELQMRSGHVLQLKFCQTCRLFRPPRVSHCSLCNACIANFDHHCPWVGNCVGLRNYRYFYLFLLSLSLLCTYIFVFNIVNIVLRSQNNSTVADAIRETPATMAEALICFFSIWSIIGLWSYHTYLICRSVTTNEDIKDTWATPHRGGNQINPFSRGNGLVNCFATLCGPLPPSFLNLRAFVKEENSIPMTITGTNNNNNTSDGIVGYFPEENGNYSNRVGNTSGIHSTQQQRYLPRDYA